MRAGRRRAPDRGDPVGAALRAFDQAIAANPSSAKLKARRAALVKQAGDSASAHTRLAEVEALMREPGIDPDLALELLQRYDQLMVEASR